MSNQRVEPEQCRNGRRPARRQMLLAAAMLASLALATAAPAATLKVIGVNKDKTTPDITASTRWTLEVDSTYHVAFDVNGNPVPDNNTSSVNFHPSYMELAATGSGAILPTAPNTDYFISVMPTQAGTYSIGGTAFRTDALGNASVVVTLNQLPLPTAQITVFIFEDDYPTNNAPDLPEEEPTAEDCDPRTSTSGCMAGFSIVLEDAGGRYGASAGTQMMDAFGNPLGTTYDAGGNVVTMGTGVILTDAEGMATIKNLAPGKYGIIVNPPANQGWQQTTTIEGTKVIDAWVKANEPPYFQEFGPPGPHVFMGFIRQKHDGTVLTGGATISGRVVNQHLSKPPDYSFYNGAPNDYTTCWVALNTNGGLGAAAHVSRCEPGNTFSITGVPPGTYQLGIWDENLDQIFAAHTVTVGNDLSCNGGGCNLTDIPVFSWFTATHHYVFLDADADGFRDADEPGIPEQNINLRWRDGTINQAAPTDGEGFVPFDEVFPFFAWQVAEVDFARFKATGVTVTVDDGGPIDPGNPLSFEGKLNPQAQTCTADDVAEGVPGCGAIGDPRVNPQGGGVYQRTYTGPVLTLGYQGFLGQTSVFEWGKLPYGPGENGGVSGIVFYDTTRAENDPAYAGPEVWQPGVPGVTVNLYDATGTVLLATAQTDSWDDSVPTGCQGEPFVFDPDGPGPVSQSVRDCYDGLRVFNQVRPAVFDGGYAFTECEKLVAGGECVAMNSGALIEPIPQGQYVVEVVPPAAYKVGRGADKNVDFGDEFVPSGLLLPPPCVGEPYVEPDFLSLFPGVENPSAGASRNMCNKKLVTLATGQNGAADFFLFTDVPVSGHINGFILDDTANEFDPNSPNFGEKYAPPWLPVSIRDWTGREISRVYSDQYGVYQALVPSTYSANLPQPSGMSPNMLTVCLNSPLIPVYDAAGTVTSYVADPRFNPQYSQFCYTFQYMPGVTTYLDTPVVPTAAFAGTSAFPLDCELPTGTPVIRYANDEQSQNTGNGPWVTGAGDTLFVASMGQTSVPNPSYGGVGSAEPKTIFRDYGFGGTEGQVWIGSTQIPPANVTWTAAELAIVIPAGVTTGQLRIVRGDNSRPSVTGVTVTVGGTAPIVVGASRTYKTIQAAIDIAPNGSLITVEPGTYEELVVMWKPIRLQGWGAGSTVINAIKVPAEKLLAWRNKIRGLVTSGAVSLLPAQEAVFGGLEPDVLFTEEGPGVIVLSRNTNNFNQGRFGLVNGQPNARIDAFTITGGDNAGGIFVNAYADFMAIANNRIVNNAGIYGGGVRIGHPLLTNDNTGYVDADNDSLSITNNHIAFNGGQGAFGGGVSLCTGTDGYRLTDNFICGNFSLGEGGGIGHIGVSNDALIANNAVLFNETFNQGQGVHGGGIFIGGGAPLAGQTLSEGSGSVRVLGNLILGNLAGAGDGGGVRLSRVNGQDVSARRNQPSQWFSVTLVNNIIANNVAGLAGAGISLFDTVRSSIVHNTIVNNDSTATAGAAFTPGIPDYSNAQPAGVVSRALTTVLFNAIGAGNQVDAKYKVPYANPDLVNNIIRHNRSFYFQVTPGDPATYGLVPDLSLAGTTPVYADLAVLDTAAPALLNPTFSLLTSTAGYAASNFTDGGNLSVFVTNLPNHGRNPQAVLPEQTTIQTPAAFDEGGNFIKVQFGPLTLTDVASPATFYRDYHLASGSPAIDRGTLTVPGNVATDAGTDFDKQTRPAAGTAPDAGADETPTITVRLFHTDESPAAPPPAPEID